MASNVGPKNVVVFGESGSGKSSVINLLTQSSKAQVSSRAIGCTFEYQRYEHGDFTFYDTVGLSEGTKGRVTPRDAIKNLVSLLKNLSGGVSLLIYVIPQGRIKEMTEKNYKLFVSGICQKDVPVILVLTKCEMENSMDSWWEENECHFRDYDMNFADVISGTAADPAKLFGVVQELVRQRREETRQRLEESIRRYSLEVPWKMASWVGWLKVAVNNVWKYLFTHSIFSFLPALRDIFMSDGQMSQQEATELSNNIAVETRPV